MSDVMVENERTKSMSSSRPVPPEVAKDAIVKSFKLMAMIALVLFLCFCAPILIGILFGHIPGMVAAGAAVLGWIVVRSKAKEIMTPVNSIFWGVLLVFLILVLAYEGLRVLHLSA